MWKFDGKWRLPVDYQGLNEVKALLSTAVLDMLELHHQLESKAAKWSITAGMGRAFSSIPLAAVCVPQFASTRRGVRAPGLDSPRVETHPCGLCTDSDCTGTG